MPDQKGTDRGALFDRLPSTAPSPMARSAFEKQQYRRRTGLGGLQAGGELEGMHGHYTGVVVAHARPTMVERWDV
jgi:hypothetical protein